ncbi:MAG: hypothetical protein PHP85_09495 [Gallionella sp.]|nr:hypothetical protein [Gallionella sp.]
MPFTPFHFGPGAALHAAAPRHVSFLAFCAANVIIDMEPLYFMATEQFPLHRFFHTYIGASVILLLTVALFMGTLRLASVVALPNMSGWKQLTLRQVVFGAALGSYSHIVFDSIMHSDIRPFAPLSDGNPLLGLVSLGTLHWSCLAAGAVGFVVSGIRREARQ